MHVWIHITGDSYFFFWHKTSQGFTEGSGGEVLVTMGKIKNAGWYNHGSVFCLPH